MSATLADLWAAREHMKKASHGIGEPAVGIDPSTLLINPKAPDEVHMTMVNLIALVGTVLAYEPPHKTAPETP